ncbi:hypothetical protein [Actinomadura sp. NPDC048394]
MLHAHSIQVLTIEASLIARVTSFQDPALFATFGLPDALPPTNEPTMD